MSPGDIQLGVDKYFAISLSQTAKKYKNLKIQGPKGPFYIDKIKRKGYKTMETIRINQGDQTYKIKSIIPISPHVLQVAFAAAVPAEYGDIQVYTAGGICCANLPGYSTVYRAEGQTVYLSDDGSVYEPPKESEPIIPPEPYVPTAQELLEYAREAKKREVNSNCEKTIMQGIDVTLSDGTVEHFDLKDRDQINLFGKQLQVANGVERIEYHTDTNPVSNCKYYSNADMQKIIAKAIEHVSYHQTYCINLKSWIDICQTAEEVQSIFYGISIPEEYRGEVTDTYILKMAFAGEGKENETAS